VVAPVVGDNDGQESYSKAFALLKEGQYEQSITAFEKFKASYPNSKYADNAQYWLGEANYVSRDYKKALSEFQQLIAQFPESTKNPGARLKMGYVYFELKNWSAARDALQQVITLYPDTTVAKKANERLQRMKREGH
jgi:tol-pal system protein YbgF